MGKIVYLSMSPADNGHKINYDVKEKSPDAGEFEPMRMKHKELVFSDDEFDEAIKKYKELAEMSRK